MGSSRVNAHARHGLKPQPLSSDYFYVDLLLYAGVFQGF